MSSLVIDYSTVQLSGIPLSAVNVLKVIASCKSLVRYIKKVRTKKCNCIFCFHVSKNGLNKSIQDQGGLSVVQSTVVRWLSFISLLESIEKSYKQIKKVLADKKKTFTIDKIIVSQLIRLLKPFKHILVIIQRGKTPSIHMVTIAILTLREALRSYESLIKYSKDHEINSPIEDASDDDESIEEDEGMYLLMKIPFEKTIPFVFTGIQFFRSRIYQLLNTMFTLEPIHLAATLLHPRYRLLKKCSSNEVRECHFYIRNRMASVKAIEQKESMSDVPPDDSRFQDIASIEPVKKKPKRFGEDFETGNLSDEYDNESDDELSKYLEQRVDIESIDDNPLKFWYDNRLVYPILSRVARSIFSIPATTSNVERHFSASGMMISSRRTRLNPEQVNNALFVRSVKKNERS